jgi:hypothetical protein
VDIGCWRRLCPSGWLYTVQKSFGTSSCALYGEGDVYLGGCKLTHPRWSADHGELSRVWGWGGVEYREGEPEQFTGFREKTEINHIRIQDIRTPTRGVAMSRYYLASSVG